MTLADATCDAIAACTCRRCTGLLVWEPFPFNFGRNFHLGSWRCLNCGEFCVADMLAARRAVSA